jgi:hypothetical protein
MRLCSFLVDVRIPDDLTEQEQDRLLEIIDDLNLPYRLRRCVRATLDHFLDRPKREHLKVTVEN